MWDDFRENIVETCTLAHLKPTTSTNLMHEAGHPKLVLWENSEAYGGEGDSGWGDDVYLWLIHADIWQKSSNIVK